jgi:hypothetical protein
VESDAPTSAPAPTPKTEKPTVRFLLEGLLIVVSVALGFAVAQYGESRENHELADRVLKGLRAEVERNLAILEPQIAMHRKWLQALASVGPAKGGETARDVFLATWPGFNPYDIKSPFPLLTRGAWDAALSTGALRFIDYDVVAKLSQIYQWQESLEAAVQKMPYSTPAFFDPANRTAAVQQLAFQINAIELTEGFLLAAYREHLPAIRAAAEGK